MPGPNAGEPEIIRLDQDQGFLDALIEGDIGGGLGAGIASVLVRTGKYKPEKVAESGIEPTATIDSITDLPDLLS